MQEPYQSPPPFDPYESPQGPPRRSSKVWIWLLVGGVVLFVLPCAGCLGFLIYLGSYGPETSVYAGNEVPTRFIRIMESVGALEEGETILYFYSDAMTDITDGFYFVSDRKVAVYSKESGESPLTTVTFDQIADLEIYRNTSFFEDSVITLQLQDGRPVSFPVSSDADGDQRFFDAIQSRVGGAPTPEAEDAGAVPES